MVLTRYQWGNGQRDGGLLDHEGNAVTAVFNELLAIEPEVRREGIDWPVVSEGPRIECRYLTSSPVTEALTWHVNVIGPFVGNCSASEAVREICWDALRRAF